MQNLNLRTHVKPEYNINSLNYPTEIQLSSLVPILLNYVFFYVWHDQWFKRYQDRKWLRNFTFCV